MCYCLHWFDSILVLKDSFFLSRKPLMLVCCGCFVTRGESIIDWDTIEIRHSCDIKFFCSKSLYTTNKLSNYLKHLNSILSRLYSWFCW